jgi:hypothetical protein
MVAVCPKIGILRWAVSKYRPNGVALHRQLTTTGRNSTSVSITGDDCGFCKWLRY